jgi:peptidyl-prolyl cis-trans isomerase A (cyclophilin A)
MKEFAAVFLALSLGACAVAEESVRIVMATDEGSIEIELYTEAAPITAGNFLKLTDNGDLDGGSFYRVVTYENDRGAPKIEVIQGGRGNAAAGEIEAIDHENTDRTGILHTDGVISMARDGVGTATSEFFICIGDQPGLDYGQSRNADGQGFAAFGKVVSGMDVVRRIQGLPADAASYSEYTKGQILASPVVITSVRRAE